MVFAIDRSVQVLGASDPTSGTVSLNEVVRGLGALYEKGWRPHRTILIATWDAEEVWLFCSPPRATISERLQYGLVGSTEWGEDFADWIQKHVVAYLNLGECPIPRSKHVAERMAKIPRFLDPDT
jgi:N-acetylated-alpha-linked acidic dipeptidase